jgi:cobalt-zinc-cadmium efflux system protein
VAHQHDTGEHGYSESAPSLAALSRRRGRRLSIVIGCNLAVVVAQVVGGLAAHSVGLLADAGHNLTDVAAAGLALVAVRLSRRAPTAARSFGFHRSSVLAALVNAAAILVVTVLIVVVAVQRLLHPEAVHGGVIVAVAAGALVVNTVCALLLNEHGDRHDLGMRAALLHMAGDAAASLGVVVAGAVIFVTGGYRWLDPAVSIGIAGLISIQAVRLGREVTDVLLEGTPRDVDLDRLRTVIDEVPGVESAHDLHLWSLSSEVRALSAHLVLSGHPTLEEAQVVGERVKVTLASAFDIAHATLELECETCQEGEDDPCAMDALVDARVPGGMGGGLGGSAGSAGLAGSAGSGERR